MRKRFKRAVGRASRLGGGGGCVVGGSCQYYVSGQGTTIPGVYNSDCLCVRADFENKFASAGRMVGMSGGRDLDGFVGTERSTFVSASGCGYSNASGCYANQSGFFPPMSDFTSQDAGGTPITTSGGGMVPEAFTSGGVGGLLDALAGNDAGSGGGGGGISDFLDSLADPNDISSGEFGGVDSLLDDLAGGAVVPEEPPVMSGGGDGMPPFEEPPVMSGGGDGMPPPPPVMSGGGDGMPPPPRTQPTTQPQTPSVRRRMSARVKSPYSNGRSKASPQKSFIGDEVGLAGAGRTCRCPNSVGGTTNVACGNMRCRQCCRKWSNS